MHWIASWLFYSGLLSIIFAEPPKEKPSNLPLNPHNIFTNLPIVSAGCAISGGNTVTPQMALLQTMAAMHKQVSELSYCSTTAVVILYM